ncbi:hypothetical protein [Serratia marcescens]|uniref:hypothetical protein n=1 Tax=Serratia marcescens TaxID=615 RepID=UPI0007C97838|nr:hypothetical protein [Serratia marcescens]OAH32759.1 hypothetical protein AYJ10_18630 [Serratia marcescens]
MIISPEAHQHRYPKRWMVSLLTENPDDFPVEFFYDQPEEAIRHCVHLGPQYFLDTQHYPPTVNVIRGFEADSSSASYGRFKHLGGAFVVPIPAGEFTIATFTGMLSIFMDPWDPHTENWASRPGDDEFDSFFLKNEAA